jgi:hypothetical protein
MKDNQIVPTEKDCVRHLSNDEYHPAIMICSDCFEDYQAWKRLQPETPWDLAGMMYALSSRTHLIIQILDQAVHSFRSETTTLEGFEILENALRSVKEIERNTPEIQEYMEYSIRHIFDHVVHELPEDQQIRFTRLGGLAGYGL